MRNSLRALEGVRKVEVDLDEETAIVVYATSTVQVDNLTSATAAIGFPSVLKANGE